MEIKKIEHDFTICKVNTLSPTDLEHEFCFIGKTDEELSLVCLTEFAPLDTVEREDGWKAFRIQGVLDFSLMGIVAKIAQLLAEHKISIFVLSTYNTDYILIKDEHFIHALELLELAGYVIVN